MFTDKTRIWRSQDAQQLVEALTGIVEIKDMQNFLRDVMTEKEIAETSSRLEAARMLQARRNYSDIIAKTKLSSRTVARVSDWLKNGCGGYAKVLGQFKAQPNHTPPARAD